jgi:DNA-binding MarR family transcriptional regulator
LLAKNALKGGEKIVRTVQLSHSELIQFLKDIRRRDLWMYVSLMALSHDGKCTMTQVEIGKLLGIHPTTVYKWIKELNKMYVQGKPLVRTIRQGETNVYFLLKLS